VIIWALGYFPRTSTSTLNSDQKSKTELAGNISNAKAEQLRNSYLGQIGQFIEPAMRPLGFDWKMSVSLLAGLPAKEIIVGTMGVLYQADDSGSENSITKKMQEDKHYSGPRMGTPVFTIPAALSFLIFILIYFPCFGVVATIKNESGKIKWAIFEIVYTTALAWIAAFLVFQVTYFIIQ